MQHIVEDIVFDEVVRGLQHNAGVVMQQLFPAIRNSQSGNHAMIGGHEDNGPLSATPMKTDFKQTIMYKAFLYLEWSEEARL